MFPAGTCAAFSLGHIITALLGLEHSAVSNCFPLYTSTHGI